MSISYINLIFFYCYMKIFEQNVFLHLYILTIVKVFMLQFFVIFYTEKIVIVVNIFFIIDIK